MLRVDVKSEELSMCYQRDVSFNIKDCVLVDIHKVDKGPADPQNLVIILDCKHGVYQVGAREF